MMSELSGILCRLCAENLTAACIFSGDGMQATIKKILFQHFGIEVLLCDDDHSNRICIKCWSITENFHNLYETVQQNEMRLIERINPTIRSTNSTTKLDDNVIQTDVVDAYETSHPEEIVYKVEVLEKSDLTNASTSGSTVLSVVEAELDDEKPMLTQGDVKQEALADDADEMGFEDEDHIEYNDDDGEDGGNSLDDDDDDDDEDDSSTKPNQSSVRRRKPSAASLARIELENDQIRQFYSMNCVLCTEVFGTIHDAVKHYRRSHKQPGYLSCCGKKVYRRCMALEHIQTHLNPEQHRCAQCNKVYTNKTALRTHMKRHKLIDAQVFACEQCPERFPTAQSLAKHKRLEHNDAGTKEFGCDICGKFFVTKSVLANHIRGVHENAFAHMCHICAKTFKSKQVYDLHQRQHLETEQPKLQCSICGNWLKHEHSLRKHMARHGQTEERCKLCGKVAPNRHALGNHMRYVHSERAYKCTMCEKAFKKPIGLKEHMASHMGVDLYFCPYCPKTFKSNANMHSHRKKKHLAQWQHDRDQRQKP